MAMTINDYNNVNFNPAKTELHKCDFDKYENTFRYFIFELIYVYYKF